ncbi:hypothetical protein B0H67DRAFT_577323 [Lasiosphaeris hirsuta]|uniref:Sulfate transporter protein n=1 Tax=Lasiosphaeris hirsuta TaxID=260670 RepID=A0AA40E0U5_9PEZI|nr:hypothetical protein B0H67DRAFT_577323 [Lasiosphaeris hirsuta]
MAVFVDLEDEDIEAPQDGKPPRWNVGIDAVKAAAVNEVAGGGANSGIVGSASGKQREEAHELVVRKNPNRNSMTKALGCYPIIVSVAASIDLNTLDNLSRTCRQMRANLLQYRKMLLASTLHCSNEDIPVDPDEVMRYRARAGNWFYMQDIGRSAFTAKSGRCARDLVAGCRRCGTVVCRNCAIKPPAPIVLRDRHRRLCTACTDAPLGSLVKPRLGPEFSLDSGDMERAICQCDSSLGVWLCQPCGRTIRSRDNEYRSIWKWRNTYTEQLGGLGTGIGDGDRGVPCGRETECSAAREREQQTDCDAEDAREADSYLSAVAAGSGGSSSAGSPNISANAAAGGSPVLGRRTPSPQLGPGYERHEIEGIGGVMKKKKLRMVRIGACVPEWEDERVRGEIMGREVQGRRSWCGWCWRVIPGKKDYEAARQAGKGALG